MRGLARYCLEEGFTEFTRFSFRARARTRLMKVNRELVLHHREARLRDWSGLIETTALRADVGIYVPIILISAMELLVGAVADVAKLTHLGQRLYLLQSVAW